MNVLQVGILAMALYGIIVAVWLKYDQGREASNHVDGDEA